jgi:hypothetical protein
MSAGGGSAAPKRVGTRPAAWWEKYAYGGLSCMAAACFTNPIDVIKVRLQLQGELQKRSPATVLKYRGFMHGIGVIGREEGLRGLQSGLLPSLLREGSYSTLRMGGYDTCKDLIVGWAQSLSSSDSKSSQSQSSQSHGLSMPLWQKIAAGAMAGSVSAAIANPTDLVKVRLQAQAAAVPGVSNARRYNGTFDAFRSIVATEGVAGLYRGVGPTTQRAMILTASQLPSYDHAYVLPRRGIASPLPLTFRRVSRRGVQ